MNKRGLILAEALEVINGERQDTYGSPEDSFELIGDYWTVYIREKFKQNPEARITPRDVALMMTLFKIAREHNQAKRDNLVDAAGYIGIASDLPHDQEHAYNPIFGKSGYCKKEDD